MRIHLCTQVMHLHVCVDAHMYVCNCIRPHVVCMDACMYICMYMCIFVCMYMCVYMYVFVYVYVGVYVCIHIRVCFVMFVYLYNC